MKETLTKCDQCSKVFDPDGNGTVKIQSGRRLVIFGETEQEAKRIRRFSDSHVRFTREELDKKNKDATNLFIEDIILTGEYCSVQCLIAKLISAPAKLSTLQ